MQNLSDGGAEDEVGPAETAPAPTASTSSSGAVKAEAPADDLYGDVEDSKPSAASGSQGQASAPQSSYQQPQQSQQYGHQQQQGYQQQSQDAPLPNLNANLPPRGTRADVPPQSRLDDGQVILPLAGYVSGKGVLSYEALFFYSSVFTFLVDRDNSLYYIHPVVESCLYK